MKTIFRHMFLTIKNPIALTSGTIAFLLFLLIGLRFLNINLLIGNFGPLFAYSELILHILISLLFGLFIAIHVYKLICFSAIGPKSSGIGLASSFLGIITGGCPACSITLATYFGVGGFLTFLPRKGFELKILSVLLLGRAVRYSLQNLMNCKIKPKKKGK